MIEFFDSIGFLDIKNNIVNNFMEILMNIFFSIFIMLIIYYTVKFFSDYLIKKLYFIKSSKILTTSKKINEDHLHTLQLFFKNIIKAVIIAMEILIILSFIGIPLSVSVISLGALFIVFGIASQDLINDFFKGVINLFEQYYYVKDFIKINNHEGIVRRITLRSVTIENTTGVLISIPNGKVEIIENLSRKNFLKLVDLPVAYEMDLDKIEKKVVPKIIKKCEKLNGVKSIGYMGINSLDESGITIRFKVNCLPIDQYEIVRLVNREVLTIFKKEKVEIPYNKLVLMDKKK